MSVVAGWFRWRTTPDRIRGMAAVTMIVAVLLGLITAVAFTSIAAGLRLIGQQAEPEVLATTDLYFRLNDMDAQVANVLLVGGQRGLGIDRQQAQAIYEQDRRQADQDLLHAAVVARSEPPVRALLADLGRYEALAGEAMYLDGRGPGQPGRPPVAALVLYRQATDLLRSGILPAAHALTDQNTAALDGTYQAKRSTVRYGALWVALAGVGLLAALVGMQFYFVLRFRRILNPALVGATVVTLALAAASAAGLAAQAGHLRVAKVDRAHPGRRRRAYRHSRAGRRPPAASRIPVQIDASPAGKHSPDAFGCAFQ